jgi:valyl-tRNA synthetase
MTSSLTPLINAYWQYSHQENLMDKIYPMTLRVQAFEIIRTWLFDTVVKSHFHTNSLPWREVMISGWGLDQDGKKMSKSLGNFIEPEGVIEKYSADALRYWAAGANLGQNLRYNEEEVKVGKRTMIKIWNASRLVLSHLENYEHDEKFNLSQLQNEDKWILHQLQKTLETYHKNFTVYEYSKAKSALDDFFWHDFADNYLEIVKHRLYNPDQSNQESKAAAQWTLYTLLLSILKMYAPIMPYITEEIYQLYFREKESCKSIHVSRLPEIDARLINDQLAEEFSAVVVIIAAVRKYKSEQNVSMKKELAKMTIETKNKSLEKYFGLLKAVMSIKEVEFGRGEIEVNGGVSIGVSL